MKVEIKGFDLTANIRGTTKVFEFPAMPVEIKLQVDIPDKKWDPLLQQKLQSAGKARMDEIQNLFTSEMGKIDARIFEALQKDPATVKLADEQKTANNMSKEIAESLPAHVKTACEKVYADLQKAHKELVKYQLKCAGKIAWSAVKISVAAARLGASHGADVSAWISAGKEIYAVALVIYELAKSADTVQKEVGKEYTGLIAVVAKARKETNNIKQAARQVGQVEPKIKKVEEKLGIMRPKTTGMDEKSHSLSSALDKLLSAAEKTKGKLGPKADAKANTVAAKIDATIKKIEDMQTKVQELRKYDEAVTLTLVSFRADYTKGSAATVKAVDFLSKVKELYDQAKDVVDTIKDIVELAA